MTPIPVLITDAERTTLSKAAEDVRTIGAAADETTSRCVTAPTHGSKVATSMGAELGSLWITFTKQCIDMAGDHLRTLVGAWAPPAPITFAAGYTLIRGAAE